MTTIDSYIENLHAERHKAWSEQQAVLEGAAKAKRPLTAEERQTVERTDAVIDANDAEINGWLERSKRDKEHDAARAVYEPIQRRQAGAPQADEFGELVAFMRGERPGNADNGKAWDIDLTVVAREKRAIRAGGIGTEILAAVLRHDPRLHNALNPDTAAAGGNTIPTDFVRSLYDYLETYAAVRTVATVITTAGGNALEFPKVATGGTATITGAGTAVAGSDPTFGKMTLNAWKHGELVRVPVELLQDTGVDLEGFLARDLGRAIGRKANTGYTTGSGTNEPEGVMTVCGTAVTGANGGTGIFTYDDLLDLEYSVDGMYAANNAAWMMKRATIGRARKLKNTDGAYLWQPSGIVGQPSTLDGYAIVENPAMASVGTGLLSVAFGDFSAFYIRDAGSIRLTRSDDRYFDTDEVAWKATLRTDSGLIDLTGAIKAYRGGTA